MSILFGGAIKSLGRYISTIQWLKTVLNIVSQVLGIAKILLNAATYSIWQWMNGILHAWWCWSWFIFMCFRSLQFSGLLGCLSCLPVKMRHCWSSDLESDGPNKNLHTTKELPLPNKQGFWISVRVSFPIGGFQIE